MFNALARAEAGHPLRVLALAHSEGDFKKVTEALRSSELDFISQREPSFAHIDEALVRFKPDVILVNPELPDCGGHEAIGYLRRVRPELPIIVVDCGVAAQAAVELLKAGAKDYVSTSDLLRLPFAIEHAIALEEGIRAREAAEAALRASHELLANTERTAHVGGWQWDMRCDLLTWSDEVYRIVGRQRQEQPLRHQDFMILVHPDDRQRVRNAVVASTSRREPWDVEFRIVRPDGTERYIHSQAELGHDDAGNVVGLHGTTLDLTEHRRATQRLQTSEEQFRLLVEEAPDAVLLYDQDQDRFISANKAAERLFSCSRDEILTHGPRDYYAPEQPDGRPVIDSFIEHNREVLAGEQLNFERLIFTAAGNRRLCKVRLVRLPAPGARLLRASYVDVTDERRAEQELAAQAAILTTEHELAPDAILVVNSSARIISINRRFTELFEVPAELVAARRDEPVLAWAVQRAADPEGFLRRVQYLYEHPDESGRDEVLFKDGRIVDRHTAPMRSASGEYLGRVWFFRDITELKKTEQTLRRLNRTLRTLIRANEAVVRAGEETELLNTMCEVIAGVGGYRLAWIGMVQHDLEQTVKPVAWSGDGSAYLDNLRVTWGDEPSGNGPVGHAVRSGEAQVSQELSTDPQMAPWRDRAAALGLASAVALPLKNGPIFGVLVIYSEDARAFDGDELNLLKELASDLDFGLRALRDRGERDVLNDRWYSSLEATIAAMASTAEKRDPYTAGHQQRVAKLAVAIARQLGLSKHQIKGLSLAGAIHDIGKITVPAEILNKPGKITPLELQLIRQHPDTGYEIVKGIDFPWPIADIIRQHHERLDGSGYPQGLHDAAILHEARILAVADVVESMMSHRPYRAGLGIDTALSEIEAGKQTLYDPAVVDACLKLFREEHFAFD